MVAGAPRILCLHGSGLNGAFFRAQLGRVPRSLPGVELFFLDGHIETPIAPEAKGPWTVVLRPEERIARQYFHMWESDGAWRVGDALEGLDFTWRAVRAEVEARGPFFAALGFSQGASVAAALLARQRAEGIDLGLRCSVSLCGGDWAFWHRFAPLPCSLPLIEPSLHIHGLADIYLERSRALTELYAKDDRRVLEHSGGHAPLPSLAAERKEVLAEISAFLRAHGDPPE